MAHAETQKVRKSRSRSHSAIGVTLDEGAWPKLAVREQLERFQQQKGEREIPGGLQATTDLNGGGRPDSLIIEPRSASSLTN